jgi:hypothetical protein
MTEEKMDARLESQLHELYNTPEPKPAFTRKLRARVMEQATHRRSSRLVPLWTSLTNAGRFTFGLTGAALLLSLVLLGMSLLTGQFRAHELGSGSSPETAKAATTFKPPAVYYTPPQLAPSVCETQITPQPSNASLNRPGKLIGGGVVKSGDFQINLYLFCDPSFRPDRNDTYSEIAGLGIYQSLWYNGPDVNEPESKVTVYKDGEAYTQNIPAVALQRGSKVSQKSGIIPDPSALPNWSAPELPMRYFFTIRGAQGKLYGAALSFRLINTPQGFVARDIQTEALSSAELAQAEETSGFMSIYPTVAPESLHPLLGELKTLQKQQASLLFAGPGWIHQRMRWQIAGDPYTGIPEQERPTYMHPKDYFSDVWYKIGERGMILGVVTRESRPDALYGEMILREESYVLPKPGLQNGPFLEQPTFDDGVFNSAVAALRHDGTISKQVGGEFAQYTITTGTHETQAAFDPQTGMLREVRYYSVEKDASRSLYSTGTIIILEHTDIVSPDILRLFE